MCNTLWTILYSIDIYSNKTLWSCALCSDICSAQLRLQGIKKILAVLKRYSLLLAESVLHVNEYWLRPPRR